MCRMCAEAQETRDASCGTSGSYCPAGAVVSPGCCLQADRGAGIPTAAPGRGLRSPKSRRMEVPSRLAFA